MCFPQQDCPTDYMNTLHDGLYVSKTIYECSHKCPGKVIGTDCMCACVPAQSCEKDAARKMEAQAAAKAEAEAEAKK